MKYPMAGDLARGTGNQLTGNPEDNPHHVYSDDGGLEGSFADEDDANFYADELRKIGARNVRVEKKTRGGRGQQRQNPVGRKIREGTRVVFMPRNPAALALYRTSPSPGTAGRVVRMPLPGGRATYLPGPGGGLVYVYWDGMGTQGIAPGDLELEAKFRRVGSLERELQERGFRPFRMPDLESNPAFPTVPPPSADATNALMNYLGKARVWAWIDDRTPPGKVMVKQPGYLPYSVETKYVKLDLESNPGRVVLREKWEKNTTIVIEDHGGARYSAVLESANGNRLPISFGTDDPQNAREAMASAKKFLRGVHGRNNPLDEDHEDTDILDGMARCIWVMSWADWYESLDKSERKALRLPASMSGREYDDVAPETPESAFEAARDLYLLVTRANLGKGPSELFQQACQVDGCAWNAENAHLFGHYLAMQSMGEGVSWFDDHKEFPLKFPRGFEAHYDDGTVWWSPQVRSRMNPHGGRS